MRENPPKTLGPGSSPTKLEKGDVFKKERNWKCEHPISRKQRGLNIKGLREEAGKKSLRISYRQKRVGASSDERKKLGGMRTAEEKMQKKLRAWPQADIPAEVKFNQRKQR